MKPSFTLNTMRLIFDPWVAAQQELEAEREFHPRFADQRNLLGLLYLERGNPIAALAEFEAALDVNPEYLNARLNRMLALRRVEGSLDSAAWNREGLIERLTDPARSLWTAWYLAQRGDLHGAKLALDSLAKEPRWAALAGFALGAFAQGAGDPTLAQTGVDQAAAAHPLYRRILESIDAVGKQGGGLPGLIGSAFTGANGEAWNPAIWQLDEFLGTLCARNGASEQAERHFERSFLCHGDESLYLLGSARLCLARGQEDEAVRVLCRAIEIDPTSVDGRVALGFEYQSQGFHDEAMVQFEVAARLQPGYPDLQYNLGLLYEAQGRESDAIRCYRRALELNAGYFPVRTSLARLLFLSGQFHESIQELDAILGTGIRSADLLVQKAECLLGLNQAQAAVALLEKAANLNPAFPRTYHVLGQAYRATGLKRKAQEAWKNYLETTRLWQDAKPLPDSLGRRQG